MITLQKLSKEQYNANINHRDLQKSKIYRSVIDVEQGKMKGKQFISDLEYLRTVDGNVYFKIVKIHTPEVAKELNRSVGDQIWTGIPAISQNYYEI